ncbi:MAG: hypothetical protein HY362_00845 [Candidatus Aenigmarchaeota archaeon]|nr:hypothetical protein [Candidatus Aenigmarchaeota archaeon]
MKKLVLLFLLLGLAVFAAGCTGQTSQGESNTSQAEVTTTQIETSTTQLETHEGKISLSGNQEMVIENKPNYVQIGNIELFDNAKLTIGNSNVIVKKQGPRAEILMHGNSTLEIINSRLVPPIDDPANLYLTAYDTSSILIDNSTFYNVMNLVNGVEFVIKNGSRLHSSYDIAEEDGAFGILQVCCQVKGSIKDSEVGSIGLFYGPGEAGTIENLKTGNIDNFSVLGITIENSKILPPKKKGPYERGWSVFADETSKVTVKNSNLNKFVFQEIKNKTTQFEGLKSETYTNLDFGSVHIENVNVYNEWGLFLRNSNVTIKDSDGIWLFPFENSKVNFVNSTMVEFDPRGFTGELNFEGGKWLYAGEIIENNDFTISGTYEVDQGVRDSLVWDGSSKVKRFFSANISIDFNKENFRGMQSISLNGKTYTVNFFTTTPIG